MTRGEYAAEVGEWFTTASHPTLGRPYLSCGFTPMIELLRYLEANGFTTHIASGGDRDFMRPFAEGLYGIPPERVIGSAIGLDFDEASEVTGLLYKSKIEFFDDGPEKPVRIWSRLGRRPLVAGGNSNGDVQMLRFARAEHRPSLRLLVLHDDAGSRVRLHAGRRGRPGPRPPSDWTVMSIKRRLDAGLPRPLTVGRPPDWQDERMRLAVATPVRPLQSAPPDELADIVRDEAFVVVEVDELDQVVRDVLGLEALHLADHDLATGPTYDSAYRSGTLEAVVPVADAAGCHPLYVAATAKALVARQRHRRRGPGGVLRTRSDGKPTALGLWRSTCSSRPACDPSARPSERSGRPGGHRGRHDRERDRHHVSPCTTCTVVIGMRRALSEYGDRSDMNESRHRRRDAGEVLDLAHAHAGAVAAVQSRLAVVRDEAANAMELYRSLVTTRQGLVINRLTVVSGVLLPLTVITGFFGMTSPG